MKVTRRRALFYQRRTSNLYRLFGLAFFILAGAWVISRLTTGEIRNPFDPTPTPTRTINSWVLEGEASFEAGNLPAAITAYQEAVKVDPNNAGVLAELARIQTYSSRLLSNDTDRLARLTDALKSADQAKAIAPDDGNVLAIRAFVLDWNADPNLDPLRTGGKTAGKLMIEAEQEALRAISVDGKDPLALAFYAEILIDEQKWTQAQPNIQSALQLGPQVMDVHRVYGYYLESNKYYSQAIEEYQKALTVNPNLTFLYISIGHNYRALALDTPLGYQQTQFYNQALESYAKAVRLNEHLKIRDPSPYLAIAKTYAQQGEFFAAALNAQKAIELDPENADLYGQLGNVYKRGRNFETAIVALKCAVRGCTAADSCVARNGCPAGDPGNAVQPLALNPVSAYYYLDYGSVLSAWPNLPGYCTEAVDVLTIVRNAYPDTVDIVRNADVGLSICANVKASWTQTPTPVTAPASTVTITPAPYFTPTP
ncbi:MAG TPA: tetratricopeptide repeat protein [Anaerolineales bacterium]